MNSQKISIFEDAHERRFGAFLFRETSCYQLLVLRQWTMKYSTCSAIKAPFSHRASHPLSAVSLFAISLVRNSG